MAGLAALDVPTRTVRVGDAEVTLRGLSFEEIGALMLEHGDAFSRVERALGPGGVADMEAAESGVLDLLQLAPGMIDRAIAMAADEPDQVDKVRRLGAGFQQEAALIVWELTTEPAGGGKKFISRLVRLFSAARVNLPALKRGAANPVAPAPH